MNIKKYACLNQNIFENGKFKIRPVIPEDIELIRVWRNLQMDVLRQKNIINSEEQINYFKDNIWPLFDQKYPSQLIFSFIEDEQIIGYGGLVHISWEDKRAEMSFLLNPDYIEDNNCYRIFFSTFISFMKKVNFEVLFFHKLFTETYSHRNFHIDVLVENEFVLEGVLKDHNYIKNEFVDSLIHSVIKNV